jgi:hypothetical protein
MTTEELHPATEVEKRRLILDKIPEKHRSDVIFHEGADTAEYLDRLEVCLILERTIPINLYGNPHFPSKRNDIDALEVNVDYQVPYYVSFSSGEDMIEIHGNGNDSPNDLLARLGKALVALYEAKTQ